MRTTQARFTLIELLVVVAIIGILASMLLPALSKAREMGRRAVCMGNQKQIYLAIAVYADDNDRAVPSDGATGAYTSPDRLTGDLYSERYDAPIRYLYRDYLGQDVQMTTRGKFNQEPKVLRCPSAEYVSPLRMTGFQMHGFGFFNHTSPFGAILLDRFALPENGDPKVMMMDITTIEPVSFGGIKFFNNNHKSTGANVTSGSGDVRWVSISGMHPFKNGGYKKFYGPYGYYIQGDYNASNAGGNVTLYYPNGSFSSSGSSPTYPKGLELRRIIGYQR